MNTLNTTVHLEMVKMVNFMFDVFLPQLKKKRHSVEEFSLAFVPCLPGDSSPWETITIGFIWIFHFLKIHTIQVILPPTPALFAQRVANFLYQSSSYCVGTLISWKSFYIRTSRTPHSFKNLFMLIYF